jgi:hypothetical protein
MFMKKKKEKMKQAKDKKTEKAPADKKMGINPPYGGKPQPLFKKA